MEWHRRMFEGTKEDIAGKIRDYDVRVGQSEFVPPPHDSVGAPAACSSSGMKPAERYCTP